MADLFPFSLFILASSWAPQQYINYFQPIQLSQDNIKKQLRAQDADNGHLDYY